MVKLKSNLHENFDFHINSIKFQQISHPYRTFSLNPPLADCRIFLERGWGEVGLIEEIV